MSSIGIGGAKVDTVLDDPRVMAGGVLSARSIITMGSTAQIVRAVELQLVTHCLVEKGDTRVPAEILLTSGRVEPGPIAAGDTRELVFNIDIPDAAPLSVGRTRTVLRTKLDIANAIDPKDSDEVIILPTRAMSAVLEGMQAAGFRLATEEVEYNARRKQPFVQEFDFRPTGLGTFRFRVEEAEISFSPIRGGVEATLTVDRRVGLIQAGGERKTKLKVREADLPNMDLAAELRQAIALLAR
ncbi:sporulation protein [Paracoccus sp. ME4]|uniref:sporulation protein n=1 Tax=Paracoccus sp. ME4 TaxID=3138066 RepID=UPI00398A5B1A